MVEGTVTIQNKDGIHARPATRYISFVSQFRDSEVTLIKNGRKGNGKSIISVLTLGLDQGSEMTVQVSGGDEQAVLAQILDFVRTLKDGN